MMDAIGHAENVSSEEGIHFIGIQLPEWSAAVDHCGIVEQEIGGSVVSHDSLGPLLNLQVVRDIDDAEVASRAEFYGEFFQRFGVPATSQNGGTRVCEMLSHCHAKPLATARDYDDFTISPIHE